MELTESQIRQLANGTYRTDPDGFDMVGPRAPDSKESRFQACDCRWSFKWHGDKCPEHGHHGRPIYAPEKLNVTTLASRGWARIEGVSNAWCKVCNGTVLTVIQDENGVFRLSPLSLSNVVLETNHVLDLVENLVNAIPTLSH